MTHAVVSRKATGLGSDLVSVVGALHYARSTGRDLVIDWRNSAYLGDRGANLFPLLFDIPSVIDDVKVIVSGRTFNDASLARPVRYSEDLDFDEFHREMTRSPRRVRKSLVVTQPMHYLPSIDEQRELFSFIRPVPALRTQISEFRRRHFAAGPIAGIHIRHGNGESLGFARDQLIDSGVEALVAQCSDVLSRFSSRPGRVFLCTDSLELREAFLQRFPDLCHFPSVPGRAGDGGIHNSARGLTGAEHAAMEMWLLSCCDMLLYNPSWFSHPARVIGNFIEPPVNLDSRSDYGTMRLYEKRIEANRPGHWHRLRRRLKRILHGYR